MRVMGRPETLGIRVVPGRPRHNILLSHVGRSNDGRDARVHVNRHEGVFGRHCNRSGEMRGHLLRRCWNRRRSAGLTGHEYRLLRIRRVIQLLDRLIGARGKLLGHREDRRRAFQIRLICLSWRNFDDAGDVVLIGRIGCNRIKYIVDLNSDYMEDR